MPKTIILVLFTLVCFTRALSQYSTDTTHKPNIQFATEKNGIIQKPFFLKPVIPANFYASHLPFFCSNELKMEKTLKFPVKIRLGSVEYCDRMEGKSNK